MTEKEKQLNEVMKISLLYDFYGKLLTEKQQQVMSLYHEENFSLSEIAKEFSISRQGVHDTLKNAEKALQQYEEKLGLINKFEKSRKVIEAADKTIESLIVTNQDNRELTKKLGEIKAAIDGLD